MKDIIIAFVALIIWIVPPYIVVFIAWLLTGLAFSYQVTVMNETFYFIASIYWVALGWAPASAWASDRLDW